MNPVLKNTRLSVRFSGAVGQKLRTAAMLSGTTLNDFIVQAAVQKARQVMDRESHFFMTPTDAVMLLDLLDAPPKPNAARKRAYGRFMEAKYGAPSCAPEESG